MASFVATTQARAELSLRRLARLLTASRAVLALAAVCLLLTGSVWGLSLMREYRQQLANAHATAARMAGLMAEHAARSFEGAFVLLGHLRIEVDQLGLEPVVAPEGGWSHLTALAREQPQLGGMALVDPAGRIITAADDHGLLANLDLSRLLAAHADGGDASVIATVPGRLGHGAFAVSRRLAARDGSTVAIAVVLVSAHYFDAFYANLDPGPNGAVGLVGESGGILVRRPAPQPHQQMAAATVQIPDDAHHLSPLDGVERVVVTKPLTGLPVRVFAALALGDVLGGWYGLVAVSIASAASGIMFLGFLVWWAWRAARSEEEARASLAQSLAEKNLLFQEIHHRVKNNLQVVSHMINMQAMRVKDPEARAALVELIGRVTSMSLVHEILYRHDEANAVALDPLLRQLCAAIARSYDPQRRITVSVDACGHRLDLQRAVPLALAANEAIANAYKHAFPGGRRGALALSVVKTGGHYRLRIRDDGIGMPHGPRRDGSLGMRLVEALATQLGGTCRVVSGAETGTAFELDFSAGTA